MKNWITAARLRTLPLSVAGAILAGLIAYSQGGNFPEMAYILFLLTFISMQILSNFANDYGDAVKGTDDNRVGETRTVASGAISAESMKKALWVTGSICFSLGIASLLLADLSNTSFFTLLIIGLIGIWAAIQYTVGKNAFGYSGWGDLFVFLFFGITAIFGGVLLLTNEFQLNILLPASAVGLLSIGVLNLNNMRDVENDKKCGKSTLVVKMGWKKARVYHTFLLILPYLLTFIYFLLQQAHWKQYKFIIILPLTLILLSKVWKASKPETLDAELKKQALSTLFFALLVGDGHFL